MSEMSDLVRPITIEEEMRRSYLDYAMSVIVGRALPDARDGLKPVHRRVLYAMSELKNDHNKPYKKSARVVGDVIGKYHPHGDSAVYETIVRMAQDFSMRYMLVDGQGNFGSIDGDNAAAMRYTEVRMQRITHQMLADLDKQTVDFVPNYDGSEQMPEVLPTRVPGLLVNGSSGIAVGMATNIPPHNLREVIAACLALLDDPDMDTLALMEHLPGPDFPTGGTIQGRSGIRQAYETGRGSVAVRGRATVEQPGGKPVIIVTELPYQVNKAHLIERIAELVKAKAMDGISELRDESDQDGMRIVIELKRGAIAEVVLNNLYQKTALQSTFSVNTVALVSGSPRTLGLRQVLDCFLNHRRVVIRRRTRFLLRRARERAHILQGLALAIANIDQVIELIRAARTPQDARDALMARSWPAEAVAPMLRRAGELADDDGAAADPGRLSQEQAQAILELRLHRLTGLEHEKLLQEYSDKLDSIARYRKILEDPAELQSVLRGELQETAEQFGDDRRTDIADVAVSLEDADLIARETLVVTLSNLGYIKTRALEDYRSQHRGGTGISIARTKEEDWVRHLLVAGSHDTLLCFSNRGRLYWLRTFTIPRASRQARGLPIVNLLPLQEDERITAIMPLAEDNEEPDIVMATAQGTIKKVPMSAFARPRKSGLIALKLREDDHLVDVALLRAGDDIMLFSDAGRAVRFAADKVRTLSRLATGVRGMRLDAGQRIISMIIPRPQGKLLALCQHGHGKRTALSEFPTKGRATKGMIAIKTSERNGALVGAVQVFPGDHAVLMSDAGMAVRVATDEIAESGRNTQGVRAIRLRDGQSLISVSTAQEPEPDADPETPEQEDPPQSTEQ